MNQWLVRAIGSVHRDGAMVTRGGGAATQEEDDDGDEAAWAAAMQGYDADEWEGAHADEDIENKIMWGDGSESDAQRADGEHGSAADERRTHQAGQR
eukprot:1142252-Prymnesium_polylepis.1